MSATAAMAVFDVTREFHSPKRGVMSATEVMEANRNEFGFIPLNGASCLQRSRKGIEAVSRVSFP